MENIVRLRPNETETTSRARWCACCVELPRREMDGEARSGIV